MVLMQVREQLADSKEAAAAEAAAYIARVQELEKKLATGAQGAPQGSNSEPAALEALRYGQMRGFCCST